MGFLLLSLVAGFAFFTGSADEVIDEGAAVPPPLVLAVLIASMLLSALFFFVAEKPVRNDYEW